MRGKRVLGFATLVVVAIVLLAPPAAAQTLKDALAGAYQRQSCAAGGARAAALNRRAGARGALGLRLRPAPVSITTMKTVASSASPSSASPSRYTLAVALVPL